MKLHFSLAAWRNGANPTHLCHTASTYNTNAFFFTKKQQLKFRVTEGFWRSFQFLKNYQLIPKTEPMNHSNRIFNLTISSTSYQKLIHLKVFTSLFYNRLWFWCFTTWNGTVKIAYKKKPTSQIDVACKIHITTNLHFWTKISKTALKMLRILAWQL